MEKRLQEVLEKRFHKTLDTCTKEELFHALMEITKEATGNLKRNEGSKKLYYISAEFLIGKLLSNNLINLGLYEETEKVLKSHGYELCEIEELEMEPSLEMADLDVWLPASWILLLRLVFRETVSD